MRDTVLLIGSVGAVLFVLIVNLLALVSVAGKDDMYTAALIEMAANYEAAKNARVCGAEKLVVALSACKRREG